MRKRFKIKNLIRNKFQRNIFLNGRRSLLLYIGHKLSCNGARYIPSPPGEKVRMRGHKGIVESRQHRYAFLSKGGGRSPLLHTGYPRKRNGHRHVMLNLFQHLATVELHRYSKRLPQRRNIGQPLNQVQGDMKMLDCTPAKPVEPSNCARPTCLSTSSRNRNKCIQRAAPPCGISKENWCIKRCTLQILVPRGED